MRGAGAGGVKSVYIICPTGRVVSVFGVRGRIQLPKSGSGLEKFRGVSHARFFGLGQNVTIPGCFDLIYSP